MAHKTLDQWLSAYGESHQNVTNKRLHVVCVPVILWTIVAFLYLFKIQQIPVGLIIAAMTLIFYYRLKISIGLAMTGVLILSLGLCYIVQLWTGRLLEIAIALFILAWVGQFVGHKIEGKKPSFLEDLQFLLIGPLWVSKK